MYYRSTFMKNQNQGNYNTCHQKPIIRQPSYNPPAQKIHHNPSFFAKTPKQPLPLEESNLEVQAAMLLHTLCIKLR